MSLHNGNLENETFGKDEVWIMGWTGIGWSKDEFFDEVL